MTARTAKEGCVIIQQRRTEISYHWDFAMGEAAKLAQSSRVLGIGIHWTQSRGGEAIIAFMDGINIGRAMQVLRVLAGDGYFLGAPVVGNDPNISLRFQFAGGENFSEAAINIAAMFISSLGLPSDLIKEVKPHGTLMVKVPGLGWIPEAQHARRLADAILDYM